MQSWALLPHRTHLLQPLSDAVPFDENSDNAMFQRVISELKNQNKASAEFRQDAKEMAAATLLAIQAVGNRVTTLENQKWFERGIVAAIGVAGSALWNWFHSK